MVSKTKSNIVQIMPAEGWYAMFRKKDDEDGYNEAPLVCWALCTDGIVRGMVASAPVSFPEDNPRFSTYSLVRYSYEDDDDYVDEQTYEAAVADYEQRLAANAK